MSDHSKLIEPIDLNDVAIIEPYLTCSVEEGIASLTDLVTPRTIQSIQNFIERIRPKMHARLNHTYVRGGEDYLEPIENYKTLNGDGLISVCLNKVHDKDDRHEIAEYDHLTDKLKHVGSIPRHHFIKSLDQYIICLNDPQFEEGIIGAMTYDMQFFAIFAHSKNLRVVNVFNIPDALCLFEKDLSGSEFFQDCQPTGVALFPTNISKSHFEIAVISYNMEIRVWNTSDCMGRVVKLEDVSPGFVLKHYVICPRDSILRYSPDGRYLCVLAYVDAEERCSCVVVDAITLHALYRMPHNFVYGPFCCIFPCFAVNAVYSTRFAMFIPNSTNFFDLEAYQLNFFEFPKTLLSLKELCKLAILNTMDRSNLDKLPLPHHLVLFLSGNCQDITSSARGKKKNCLLM